MDTPFFEQQKITRQFGVLLVISCLVESEKNVDEGVEKGVNGNDIIKWIAKKLHPDAGNNVADFYLPSSFIYPLLKNLNSGHVPFLKLKDGRYTINNVLFEAHQKNNELTELEFNFADSVAASIEYLNNLSGILAITQKNLKENIFKKQENND
jgi:hypothetical protein